MERTIDYWRRRLLGLGDRLVAPFLAPSRRRARQRAMRPGWGVPAAWKLERGERARYTIVVLEPGEGADGRLIGVSDGSGQYAGYLTADQVRAILDAIGAAVNTRGA